MHCPFDGLFSTFLPLVALSRLIFVARQTFFLSFRWGLLSDDLVFKGSLEAQNKRWGFSLPFPLYSHASPCSSSAHGQPRGNLQDKDRCLRRKDPPNKNSFLLVELFIISSSCCCIDWSRDCWEQKPRVCSRTIPLVRESKELNQSWGGAAFSSVQWSCKMFNTHRRL